MEQENFDFEVSETLLNWRKSVCGSKLEGFVREVAVASEIVELDDRHILLRPQSQNLINEAIIAEIAGAVSEAKGSAFEVRFTADECSRDAVTVSKLEARERYEARRAMIEAFRSDPFVQKCLKTLNATLIESSVAALDTPKQ